MYSYQSLTEQWREIAGSIAPIDTAKIIRIQTRVDFLPIPRERSLIVRGGEPVYGGLEIPEHRTLARTIGGIFKPTSIDIALEVAGQKQTNPDSLQEILSLLVKMRVLTWEQVKAFFHARLVWALEPLLPYPGEIHVESDTNFDLQLPGISWTKIIADIERRQAEWALLAPTIPSMEAIPYLNENNPASSDDPKVAEHLRQWVDGRRSLVDIAAGLSNQDPLLMARGYFKWAQLEWVAFRDPRSGDTSAPSGEESDKPTILAVDDSEIVQIMIKRVLKDNYRVLLASSAREGLNLLDRVPVQLLLLDVTMPDMDGLEVCRIVREKAAFRDLPIIMLTARDGYVDRFKGYMAGSTKYLTKPFKSEELLAVISEYVGSGALSPIVR